MRSTLIVAVLALMTAGFLAPPADAQINTRRVRERAEQQARQRAERRVDQGVDNAVEAAENAVVCAVTDAECIQKARAEGKDVSVTDASGNALPKEQSDAAVARAAPATRAGEGAFVNFDFVPGERTIFFDDFARDNIGDFPRRLEFAKGNMEVAEWQGRRFLRATANSQLSIELPETLPERFTIEFEHAGDTWSWPYLTLRFDGEERDPRKFDRILIQTHWSRANNMAGGVYGPGTEQKAHGQVAWPNHQLFPVRIMVDGRYVKVYMGETRVANMPNANLGRSNRIILEWGADPQRYGLIGPIRVAAGGRKLYDAIAESGRVATQGIYFDTGSDRIRPESGPTLKEIADMLREHSELRIAIEGHTDNVGAAQANQQLSERRAAAVKAALVSQHGVDASRLQSKGLGATKPSSPNDTPEGRQNNRRVELVKI
jgi:OmpA-OmpF porin, OOP family